MQARDPAHPPDPSKYLEKVLGDPSAGSSAEPAGCSVLPVWEGRLPHLYPALGHQPAAPACSQGRRRGKELGLAGVVPAL